MEETIQQEQQNVEVIEPKLTNDQKLAIRETEVTAYKLREQARQLQENAANIEKQIAQYINQLAAELKVDPSLYTFDVNTLAFIKK